MLSFFHKVSFASHTYLSQFRLAISDMAAYIMQATVLKAVRRLRSSVTYPKHFEKRWKHAFLSDRLSKEVFGVRNVQKWILIEAHVRNFITAERVSAHKNNLGNSPNDYIAAIARREIAWISKYAVPKPSDDPLQPSKAQNSPEAHITLLQKFLEVSPYLLPQDTDLAASTLWHSDIHPGNVFISEGVVTSLIDWQATWAGPLMIQAQPPRLLNHKGEIMLRLPENFKELGADERDQLNEQVASSILLYVYETRTAKQNHLLSRVYRLNHGRTRTQAILFAGDTWTDDILPLRESLIKIER